MCRHRFAAAPRSSQPWGLGFVCINTLIWFIKASSSTSVPCGSCLTKTQITPLDCLAQVAWISSSDLHQSDQYLFGCDHYFYACTVLTDSNNIVVNLDILMVCLGSLNFKDVARGYTHSSSFKSVYPKSRQSLWACNTKGYRPENGRAPPIQVVVLGSSSDVSNTVGEQVFHALPLIITKSLVSGGPWTVPR